MSTPEQQSTLAVDAGSPLTWPPKHDVFGVQVSAVTYDEAVDVILAAAQRRVPAQVTLHAVHALITASNDEELRKRVNTFDIVAPDGQPVRWALNLLWGAGLKDRVYGPELMLRLCRQAALLEVPIYLYGSMPDVLEKLSVNLEAGYPGLKIAGDESPPFRQLSPEESKETIERINNSGAGIVFIGLGAPKQDHFAYEHGEEIQAVQVCVGAAFDFHAGTLAMAPPWMQRRGLEWLYRLIREPRRLWKRYFVTNTIFLFKLARAMLRRSTCRSLPRDTKQNSPVT